MTYKNRSESAESILGGIVAGFSAIRQNKAQSVFSLICFAAAVCTAAAMWLYSASAAEAVRYASSPVGDDAVILEVDNGEIGLNSLRELAEKHAAVFENVIPYKEIEDTELYGNKTTSVRGTAIVTDGAIFDENSIEIVSGKGFASGDSVTDGAVISQSLSEPLYGSSNPVGQQIKINGRVYTVSGIFRGKSGYDPDSAVMIPYGGARLVLGSSETGRYIFSAKSGHTDEARDLVSSCAEEKLGRSAAQYTVTVPTASESAAGGIIIIFALLMLLCFICLTMFALFPSKKGYISQKYANNKNFILYSLFKYVIICITISLAGSVLGLILGVPAAYLMGKSAGLGLCASAGDFARTLYFPLCALCVGIVSAAVPFVGDCRKARKRAKRSSLF